MYGNFDVAVAGAGVAGAAAAAAAAREGLKVCLIEKENFPGGLATAGLVAIYLPLCDGAGRQVISGIAEELLKLSLKYGPGDIPEGWKKKGSAENRKKHRYRVNFNPASFAVSLEEFLIQNNVKIFYDSRFCSCIMDKDKIKALVIQNKSGRGAVTAKTFVDATGDADVCFFAGEKTISLDSNKKAGWYILFKEGELLLRELGNSGKKPSATEKTYSGVGGRDVSEFSIESRKIILEDLKRSATVFSKTYPAFIACIPQLRMTRRIRGLYELDEREQGKYFQDAVCMTGDWRKPGPVFCIPYRCLIGKIKNLFTAGRCISVKESMWDITRAIPACAATGEAAGTAAAVCSKNNLAADDVNIEFLQNKLIRNGVIINRGFCSETKEKAPAF